MYKEEFFCADRVTEPQYMIFKKFLNIPKSGSCDFYKLDSYKKCVNENSNCIQSYLFHNTSCFFLAVLLSLCHVLKQISLGHELHHKIIYTTSWFWFPYSMNISHNLQSITNCYAWFLEHVIHWLERSALTI